MATEISNARRVRPRLEVWAGTIAAYFTASLVQVLMYGAAASGDSTRTTELSAGWPSELFEISLVLTWLLGPAALATWFSARKLRFWTDMGTERLGVARALAVVLLPVLSSYLGAVASVNIWGT